MKKLIGIVSLLALIVCANAESKVNFGLEVRSRMAMGNIGQLADKDGMTMKRYTDIRFRPTMEFVANDMLSAKAVLNIGDLQFGNANYNTNKYMMDGVTIGTNAHLTVKQAYLTITPAKEHVFTLGQQYFYDAHSLIMDDYLPGLRYDGTFGQAGLSAAWYVPVDGDELNIDKSTYSKGSSLFMLNPSYKINDKMSADLLFVADMGTDTVTTANPATDLVNKDHFNMWIAPHFIGDFGMVKTDAMFAYTNRSYSWDKIKGGSGYLDATTDAMSGSGMAASLKFNIVPTEQLTVGVNFLYLSSRDPKDAKAHDGFGEGISTYYYNDLQVLTQYGNEDANNLYGALYSDYGVMLPSLIVNYKMNDKYAFGGGFGMAMTLEDVAMTSATGQELKDTNLGMEFSVNSTITAIDNLTIAPFAAFFMPGKAYAYGLQDANGTPMPSEKTDMQMKIGATLTAKF